MSFNSRTLGRVRLGVTAIREPFPCFNSRTLGRVRLEKADARVNSPNVSIHAPWEGCDGKRYLSRYESVRFQFTHPGKGATLDLSLYLAYQPVSIHAPWEGCDIWRNTCVIKAVTFQFTHPGKGATLHRDEVKEYIKFQFTHPGKGATGRSIRGIIHSKVSIHAPWEGCDYSDT